MENIFDYAKKELSQDAVITCILKERDKNSEKLIRLMLGTDCPAKFEIKEVKNQVSKIDVLVTIEVEDEKGSKHLEAIIIEDKTNTFLHDDQLKKYVDAIANRKTINNIYFVLFKTGDYYFWERDMYNEMQSNYKPTHKKTIVYKEFLLNDFITFLSKANLEYGWIADYRTHMGKPKGVTWCTGLTKKSQDFVKDITGGKWVGGSKNYKFGKASGNGDKGYELWLQGVCGPYIPGKPNPTVKECYYLLPIVCLPTKDNNIIIKLNIHLNLSSKSPHGYLPLTQCVKPIGKTEMDRYRELQKKVIDDYKGDVRLENFTFTDYGKKTKDFLQICSYKTTRNIKVYKDVYKDVIDKIKNKLPALIDIVDEIDMRITSGYYDSILI